MGVFEIEANGKVYEIEAPDQGAAVNAFKSFNTGQPAQAEKPGAWDTIKNTAADVAQALPTGVLKGAIGLAGLPGDAAGFLGRQADALAERITGQPVPEAVKANKPAALVSGENLTRNFEAATGKLYEPQTTAGKFARTVGEFIPTAGGSLASQLRFAVAPGIASEAAGQATQGTALEPLARAGAAIAAGGAATLVGRGNRAPQALAPAIQGVDDASLVNARALMDDAAQRGVTLTWDEAINQVTGGATNLAAVRRVAEQSPEGAAILRPVMAERPRQVTAAAGRALDDIGPQAVAPSSLGREAGTIAEGRVNQVRDTINAASEPYYDRSALVRLSAQDMQRVRALPGYQEAAAAVRNDPQLARYVQGLPEDSVGFLNEVKKQLDQSATNASSAVNAQQNMQRSAGYGSDATVVREAAERASGDYARALEIQRRGREEILQPILDGPLGRIAKHDTTTKQAIDALPASLVVQTNRDLFDFVHAPSGNLIANGLLGGASGTMVGSNWASGSAAPDEWTVTDATGISLAQLVSTLEMRPDGRPWRRFDIPETSYQNSSNPQIVLGRQVISASHLSSGNEIEAVCEFDVSAGALGLAGIGLFAAVVVDGVPYVVGDNVSVGPNAIFALPPVAHSGILRTPRLTIPAGTISAASVYATVQIANSTTIKPVKLTARIGGISLRKVG